MTRVRDIAVTVMAAAVTLVCILIIITWLRLGSALSGVPTSGLPDPGPVSTCVEGQVC